MDLQRDGPSSSARGFVADNKIDLDAIFSHTWKLDQADEADRGSAPVHGKGVIVSDKEKVMKSLSLVMGVGVHRRLFRQVYIKKLRDAHVGVANAPQTLYADEVAKLVKERTNGRVEIEVFANSQSAA